MTESDLIAERAIELISELIPSMTSAFGCLDCGLIFKAALQNQCRGCGGSALLNVAEILSGKPVRPWTRLKENAA